MKTAQQILKKELAVHGFRLSDTNSVEFMSGGQPKACSIGEAIAMLDSEIRENQAVLLDLWKQASSAVSTQSTGSICDPKRIALFIFSLKDLMKLGQCFPRGNINRLTASIEQALCRDISTFSNEQIDELIDTKMTVDWVHRLISRLDYTRKLLKLAGKPQINVQIKTAQQLSNLDLSMKERVWEWAEDEESFRERAKDMRGQQRYQKGFEAYNNDGRVGEGHYLRFVGQEPQLWDTFREEEAHKHRSSLFGDR